MAKEELSSALHETGCAFCGSTDDTLVAQCAVKSLGVRYCHGCAGEGGQFFKPEAFDAEITRRRSLAEPGFKVGDEVVVHGCNAAGGYWNGKTGTIEAPRRTAGSGFNVAMGAQGSVHFETKELRLIRAALAEAARTGEARLYGTQPDVLPETLPDGTVWAWNGGWLLYGVRLMADKMHYAMDRWSKLDGSLEMKKGMVAADINRVLDYARELRSRPTVTGANAAGGAERD